MRANNYQFRVCAKGLRCENDSSARHRARRAIVLNIRHRRDRERKMTELGVHSIGEFVLAVPALTEAEHFYKSFGLVVTSEAIILRFVPLRETAAGEG